MLAAILTRGRAAGGRRRQRRHAAASTRCSADEPYDVLAVELSSFQLHWAPSLRAARRGRASTSRPTTSTGTARFEAYAADKGRVYERTEVACVYNVARPASPRSWCARPTSQEGCRAIGFTLGVPGPSDARRRRRHPGRPGLRRPSARTQRAAELGTLADVRRRPARPAQRRQRARRRGPGPRLGVAPAAVRDGLRGFRPDPHRIAARRRRRRRHLRRRLQGHQPARRGGVAARRSTHVVWVAGGLAKGADFDELVARAADRLRGVVLIGRDRALIARSARATRARGPGRRGRQHATLASMDDGRAPRPPALARPGDTVLLAPAAAPRWTCSPTTASAATRSPTRCAARPVRGREHRPRTAAAGAVAGSTVAQARARARPRGSSRPLTSYYLLLGHDDAAARARAWSWCSRPRRCTSLTETRARRPTRVFFEPAGASPASASPCCSSPRGCPSGRSATWPCLAVLLGSVALLCLVFSPLGVEVNGNRNWIDFGGRSGCSRPRPPSSRWSSGRADPAPASAQLLDQWQHLLVPLLPVARARDRAGPARPRPRHRARARRDPRRAAVRRRRARAAASRLRSPALAGLAPSWS